MDAYYTRELINKLFSDNMLCHIWDVMTDGKFYLESKFMSFTPFQKGNHEKSIDFQCKQKS